MLLKGVKKGLAFALLLAFMLNIFYVSSYSFETTSVNSTYIRVDVSDADDLYGYELNFSYTGSVSAVDFSSFLISDGGSQSTGYTTKGSVLFVYATRLDATQSGIDGSGNLFNITQTGETSLLGGTSVSNAGGTEFTTYTIDSSGTATAQSGSSSKETLIVSDSEINVDFSINEFIVNLIAGKTQYEKITLTNKGSNSVKVDWSVKGLEDYIGSSSVNLALGETREVTIPISSSQKGLLVGVLVFSVGGKTIKEIPVTLNVRTQNFLFDASLAIAERSKVVSVGDPVQIQVNLQEVIAKEKLDVFATYIIKDFGGVLYHEESETFFVESEKEFLKEFDTNSLLPGKYVIGMELSYPGAFATTSAVFEVVERSPLIVSLAWILFIIIFVCVILLILWASHRRRRLHHTLHYHNNSYRRQK